MRATQPPRDALEVAVKDAALKELAFYREHGDTEPEKMAFRAMSMTLMQLSWRIQDWIDEAATVRTGD